MFYFSVTSLKDYLNCPKLYWYSRFRKTFMVPDKYVLRGTIVHKAIEESDNEDSAILLVHELYGDNDEFMGQDTANELEAIKMVHNYYTKIEPQLDKRDTDYIEMQFKIPWNGNDYRLLVGKIDRIDLNYNRLYDWKTTIPTPDAYDLQDMQFYVYTWVYEYLYKRKPEVFYGHLYSGELFPIDIHDEMWYNIKRLIDETVDRLMTKGVFYPRLFGYRCQRCFYKGVCLSDYELGN